MSLGQWVAWQVNGMHMTDTEGISMAGGVKTLVILEEGALCRVS